MGCKSMRKHLGARLLVLEKQDSDCPVYLGSTQEHTEDGAHIHMRCYLVVTDKSRAVSFVDPTSCGLICAP